MTLLEDLQWRYATKKYDAERSISAQDIDSIKEAIRLSASSFGLQLYQVLDVREKDLREQLVEASWGQRPVADASHLFVFCTPTEARDEMIDSFVKLKSETQGIPLEGLNKYGDFIKGFVQKLSPEQQRTWMAKQVYIALGNALMACAHLKIDSTPMEGFDPARYDELLGLKEKGLTSTVVLALGYRSADDETQGKRKIRRPTEELFRNIN